MKWFDPIAFDPAQCRREVLQLRNRLAATRPLRERRDILPFFRARPSLSAACGVYNTTLLNRDRVAWEYDLFGDFTCDIAVGDSATRCYTFVELEDADANSLFVKEGKRAARGWAPRFLRGYAQIIDWFRKLDDRRNSDEFEARFGKRWVHSEGLLVIGRDHDLRGEERPRLEWWREHLVVHSRRIHCVTYDELVSHLLLYLQSSSVAPPPTTSGPTRSRRRQPPST